VLLHLIDATSSTLSEDFQVIEHELEEYGAGLGGKPRVIGLNKADALDNEAIAAAREEIESQSRLPVFTLSAVPGQGVPEILRILRQGIDAARLRNATAADASGSWQP
jgi:GTP-binding protein